jgi:hypothetical protein
MQLDFSASGEGVQQESESAEQQALSLLRQWRDGR